MAKTTCRSCQGSWCELLFDLFYVQENFPFGKVSFLYIGHVSTLAEEDEQITQTLKVVSPGGDFEVELAQGRKDHVTPENIDLLLRYVVVVFVDVLGAEAEVAEAHLVHHTDIQSVVSDEDVVEFQVVVYEACAMHFLKDFDQPDAQLEDCLDCKVILIIAKELLEILPVLGHYVERNELSILSVHDCSSICHVYLAYSFLLVAVWRFQDEHAFADNDRHILIWVNYSSGQLGVLDALKSLDLSSKHLVVVRDLNYEELVWHVEVYALVDRPKTTLVQRMTDHKPLLEHLSLDRVRCDYFEENVLLLLSTFHF